MLLYSFIQFKIVLKTAHKTHNNNKWVILNFDIKYCVSQHYPTKLIITLSLWK